MQNLFQVPVFFTGASPGPVLLHTGPHQLHTFCRLSGHLCHLLDKSLRAFSRALSSISSKLSPTRIPLVGCITLLGLLDDFPIYGSPLTTIGWEVSIHQPQSQEPNFITPPTVRRQGYPSGLASQATSWGNQASLKLSTSPLG